MPETKTMQNMSGIIPTGYHIVVLMDPIDTRTAGGIYKPDELVNRERYAAGVGTLVAAGELAFTMGAPRDPHFHDMKVKPQPGARVLMPSYEGITHKGADGVEYRVAESDSVIALLDKEQEQ